MIYVSMSKSQNIYEVINILFNVKECSFYGAFKESTSAANNYYCMGNCSNFINWVAFRKNVLQRTAIACVM